TIGSQLRDSRCKSFVNRRILILRERGAKTQDSQGSETRESMFWRSCSLRQRPKSSQKALYVCASERYLKTALYMWHKKMSVPKRQNTYAPNFKLILACTFEKTLGHNTLRTRKRPGIQCSLVLLHRAAWIRNGSRVLETHAQSHPSIAEY
ncbi:hypothetical protein PLICRDRAFT_351604, partial [Plicaturopsis crispa FD-325 SS-3]